MKYFIKKYKTTLVITLLALILQACNTKPENPEIIHHCELCAKPKIPGNINNWRDFWTFDIYIRIEHDINRITILSHDELIDPTLKINSCLIPLIPTMRNLCLTQIQIAALH